MTTDTIPQPSNGTSGRNVPKNNRSCRGRDDRGKGVNSQTMMVRKGSGTAVIEQKMGLRKSSDVVRQRKTICTASRKYGEALA